MPEAILDKEAIEFMTRFFGGTASALEQLLFEWWWTNHPEARNQFPYTQPEQHLPYWYIFIVGGISIGEALLGLGIEEDPLKLMEKMDYRAKEQLTEFGKALRKFGEGGVLYSVPTLTHRTIVRNTPLRTVGGSPPTPAGQSETPVSGRVIKL